MFHTYVLFLEVLLNKKKKENHFIPSKMFLYQSYTIKGREQRSTCYATSGKLTPLEYITKQLQCLVCGS